MKFILKLEEEQILEKFVIFQFENFYHHVHLPNL